MKELETRLGWNHKPFSVMFTPLVRSIMLPSEHLVFDWMHGIFVSGVFNRHMGQFMAFLHSRHISYATVHRYLSLYTWPKRVTYQTGVKHFTGNRAKHNLEDRIFKCSASEGLSLYSVIAQYVRGGLVKSTDVVVQAHAHCFFIAFLNHTLDRSFPPSVR